MLNLQPQTRMDTAWNTDREIPVRGLVLEHFWAQILVFCHTYDPFLDFIPAKSRDLPRWQGTQQVPLGHLFQIK